MWLDRRRGGADGGFVDRGEEEQAVIGPTIVERSIFCAPEGAGPVETRHGTFGLHAVTGTEDDPNALSLALQRDMTRLEVEVARAAPGDAVLREADCGLGDLGLRLRAVLREPGDHVPVLAATVDPSSRRTALDWTPS